jgi:hypothetical protein
MISYTHVNLTIPVQSVQSIIRVYTLFNIFSRTLTSVVREKLVGTSRCFDEVSLLKEELKTVQKARYACFLIHIWQTEV